MSEPISDRTNAELHALIEEFRESSNKAEAALGLILHRQAGKYDGELLELKVREVIYELTTAIERFDHEKTVLLEEESSPQKWLRFCY